MVIFFSPNVLINQFIFFNSGHQQMVIKTQSKIIFQFYIVILQTSVATIEIKLTDRMVSFIVDNHYILLIRWDLCTSKYFNFSFMICRQSILLVWHTFDINFICIDSKQCILIDSVVSAMGGCSNPWSID